MSEFDPKSSKDNDLGTIASPHDTTSNKPSNQGNTNPTPPDVGTGQGIANNNQTKPNQHTNSYHQIKNLGNGHHHAMGQDYFAVATDTHNQHNQPSNDSDLDPNLSHRVGQAFDHDDHYNPEYLSQPSDSNQQYQQQYQQQQYQQSGKSINPHNPAGQGRQGQYSSSFDIGASFDNPNSHNQPSQSGKHNHDIHNHNVTNQSNNDSDQPMVAYSPNTDKSQAVPMKQEIIVEMASEINDGDPSHFGETSRPRVQINKQPSTIGQGRWSYTLRTYVPRRGRYTRPFKWMLLVFGLGGLGSIGLIEIESFNTTSHFLGLGEISSKGGSGYYLAEIFANTGGAGEAAGLGHTAVGHTVAETTTAAVSESAAGAGTGNAVSQTATGAFMDFIGQTPHMIGRLLHILMGMISKIMVLMTTFFADIFLWFFGFIGSIFYALFHIFS